MSKEKVLRKQLRNIVLELLPEMLNKELAIGIEKKCLEHMDYSMTRIQQYIGDLIGRISYDVENQVYNADITLMAWEEILSDKFGLSKEDFQKLMNDKRREIGERLEAKKKAAEAAEKALQESLAKEQQQTSAPEAQVPVEPQAPTETSAAS